MRRTLEVFIIVLAGFSLVYSSAAFYLTSPKPSQQFIALGVFSPEGVLSGFSSGRAFNITQNQVLNWSLRITNRMGFAQYVRIVSKLGNGTSPTPTTVQPSSTDCFKQLSPSHDCLYADTFIANGSTISLNFTWSIQLENQTGGTTHLVLSINRQPFSSSVGSPFGRNFRFIFELWTFDLSTNSFQYGWLGQFSRVGTWLQVWFNAT